MRFSPFALVAFALLFAACDSGGDDVVLGGTYRATAQLAGADVTIDLDIPPTESGSFQLGSGSTYTARLGSSSDAVRLEGSGSVSGRSVTVTVDYPDLTVRDGEVDLEFLGSDPSGLTGVASADGTTLTLGDGTGGQTARFERQ